MPNKEAYIRTNNPKGLRHVPQYPGIKKAYESENLTDWEIEEFFKCSQDIFYFIENYVYIKGDKGLGQFKLYDYQRKMITKMLASDFVITLAPRQMGKSETFGCFIMWWALFKSDQNCFILSKTDDDSVKNLSKLQNNLERIPFFLQPGCKKYNVNSIEFENGTIIQTGSSKGIRGDTANIIFCDEFAFLPDQVKFWVATYPTITSKSESPVKPKLFVTSTPHGMGDKFHSLWKDAIAGKNEFAWERWLWTDKPRADQQKFKKDTQAMIGLEQWLSDYECEFMGSSATLLSVDALERLKEKDVFRMSPDGSIRIYEDPKPHHRYVLCSDISEGVKKDFSTFSIVDITHKPYKQVAVMQDNRTSYLILDDILLYYAKRYNNAYMIVENNDRGQVVCKSIFVDKEYDNFYVTSTKSYKDLGLRQNQNTKRQGCNKLKDLIESGVLEVVDKNTIEEFYVFEPNKTSFAAKQGHNDDLVMSLVLFAYLTNDVIFQELELTDKSIDEVIRAIRLQDAEANFLPIPLIRGFDNNIVNVWDDDYDNDENEELIFSLKGYHI